MTYEEEQLEITLDKAIDGKETSGEAEGLVKAGQAFILASQEKSAEASFSNLLNKLPQTNSPISINIQSKQSFGQKFKQDWKEFMESINIFKYFNFSPRFTKISKVLASILLVWLVGGTLVSRFVISQLVSATISEEQESYPTSYGISAGGGRGEIAASVNSLSSSELGLAQSTGLGSSDVRVTVARLVNPVALVGAAINSVGSVLSPSEPSYYPDQYYNNPPASDSREFMKLEYRATLRTRKVQEMSRRVQTMVRGYSGRVDNATTEDRYAYISFVVPKNKFEEFRAEVADLAPARFITENISSQNLLPQKQVIETDTVSNQSALDAQNSSRAELIKQHDKTRNWLNGILRETKVALAEDQAALKSATNTMDIAQLTQYIRVFQGRIKVTQNDIAIENSRFNAQLSSIDNQISYYKNQLNNLSKQDTALTETVETVRGTIQLRWISLRGILSLYVPGEWQAIIIALAIICYFIFRRRRAAIGIQPVQ